MVWFGVVVLSAILFYAHIFTILNAVHVFDVGGGILLGPEAISLWAGSIMIPFFCALTVCWGVGVVVVVVCCLRFV